MTLRIQLPDLHGEVWRLLRQVPSGRVTTYGDLAKALGDVKAARWVADFLLSHAHDDHCPCHRVVRANGEIGLYRHGQATGDSEKIGRLKQDGLALENGRVELSTPRCVRKFRSSHPLAGLRNWQSSLSPQLKLVPLSRSPRSLGGVDVSYISPTEAVGAFVVIEASSHEELWSMTLQTSVSFPYISGYLTFRELPVFDALFQKVRESAAMPDVLFVDGNGILHPRRAGSATCAGLLAEVPTIGVGKSLICGRVEPSPTPNVQPVLHNGEYVGEAVRATEQHRPFFVSPGHLIDLGWTLRVTRLAMGNRRLPLPIELADGLSRREARRVKASSPH